MANEFKAQGQAEWDQRQAFHKRIHDSIELFNDCLRREDYDDAFDALNMLYLELYPHMKEEELSNIDKLMSDCQKVIMFSGISHYQKKKFLL